MIKHMCNLKKKKKEDGSVTGNKPDSILDLFLEI